jgi:hypothetical protein
LLKSITKLVRPGAPSHDGSVAGELPEEALTWSIRSSRIRPPPEDRDRTAVLVLTSAGQALNPRGRAAKRGTPLAVPSGYAALRCQNYYLMACVEARYPSCGRTITAAANFPRTEKFPSNGTFVLACNSSLKEHEHRQPSRATLRAFDAMAFSVQVSRTPAVGARGWPRHAGVRETCTVPLQKRPQAPRCRPRPPKPKPRQMLRLVVTAEHF